MKTNIQEIDFHGNIHKGSGWWSWTETCDKCGKKIHGSSSFMTSKKPDATEKDFCVNCYCKLIKNKIPYEKTKKLCETKEQSKSDYIKFVLEGEISYIIEAPKDITLEKLLKQLDRIDVPLSCGIRSYEKSFTSNHTAEIRIDYDNVIKLNQDIDINILD